MTWPKRLAREPLVHFLLIGIALFLVYGAVTDRVAPAAGVIEVTPADVDRLVAQFQAVWRRPPTEAERALLVGEFVKDEIYYREALALGLDQGDAMVRRLMRQKMEFLGDSAAGLVRPDEATLRAFFAAESARYAVPPSVTFAQIFLGDARPGEADATLAALAGGAAPEGFGQRTLLPPAVEAASPSAVARVFGEGLSEALAGLPTGAWAGPVQSAYGQHLVRIDRREAGGLPDFATVRDAVERDWRQAEAQRLRAAQYAALLARYRVVQPAAAP